MEKSLNIEERTFNILIARCSGRRFSCSPHSQKSKTVEVVYGISYYERIEEETVMEKEAFVFIARKVFQRSPAKRCRRNNRYRRHDGSVRSV